MAADATRNINRTTSPDFISPAFVQLLSAARGAQSSLRVQLQKNTTLNTQFCEGAAPNFDNSACFVSRHANNHRIFNSFEPKPADPFEYSSIFVRGPPTPSNSQHVLCPDPRESLNIARAGRNTQIFITCCPGAATNIRIFNMFCI